MSSLNITILCRVVDNYGDIGFVYRLSRALSELDGSLRLRLIVSDLAAFKSMAPAIDDSASVQEIAAPVASGTSSAARAWQVFDWNADSVCTAHFTEEAPDIILECFQCGRPDWLEKLLFGSNPLATEVHVVRILNVEYLTAEPYADDFHCLKSGTRSIYVKKVNFMPGFTEKTGGLTLDEPFMQALSSRRLPAQVQALLAADAGSCRGAGNAFAGESAVRATCSAGNASAGESAVSAVRAAGASVSEPKPFFVPIFSYERDFTPVVHALTEAQRMRREAGDAAFSVHALVAAGKSAAPFFAAWEKAAKPFPATALPFLPQQDWDQVLSCAGFNFVRGEDSLSRACLCGVPFLWHAYPQEDEYQTVKVQALLDRLKPYIPSALYAPLERCWLTYNKSGTFDDAALLELLLHGDELTASFRAFSADLISLGNLAAHLLAYLRQ
ncbi:MAG: elongation factor P maturation arginine rhamnosyltransferase EarP [Treponema sp.]|nr:elongation factor P maturation arginine rhamnosyltransferase EarP [Treponema sp.]